MRGTMALGYTFLCVFQRVGGEVKMGKKGGQRTGREKDNNGGKKAKHWKEKEIPEVGKKLSFVTTVVLPGESSHKSLVAGCQNEKPLLVK